MLEQRQRYLSSSTVASYAEPGDCYEEIFQYVCHILRKAKRRALGLYQALQSRRQASGPAAPACAKPAPQAKEPRHFSKWPCLPWPPGCPTGASCASDWGLRARPPSPRHRQSRPVQQVENPGLPQELQSAPLIPSRPRQKNAPPSSVCPALRLPPGDPHLKTRSILCPRSRDTPESPPVAAASPHAWVPSASTCLLARRSSDAQPPGRKGPSPPCKAGAVLLRSPARAHSSTHWTVAVTGRF